MKKVATFFCAVLLLVHVIVFPASALEDSTQIENQIPRVSLSDVIDTTSTPLQTNIARAIYPPTKYAPDSWYNVEHQWTATYYTYSSYIFDTTRYMYLDIYARAPFRIDFYHPDGTFWGSATPEYNAMYEKYLGSYYLNPGEDYYMVIYNLSDTTISSGAYYKVGEYF